jgi:hypothetical protein
MIFFDKKKHQILFCSSADDRKNNVFKEEVYDDNQERIFFPSIRYV